MAEQSRDASTDWSKGLLQGQNIIQWHPAVGELFPTPGVDEIVLFTSFIERGLTLPPPTFFVASFTPTA
ncbi:retrotransposon protein, putative, unclassified [Panicum miliaceum]|uniref:Retrotransposon protein, putative, unclassified n=1 Tax=Panicum miliaceum TaxID=4540 RepID=A0A3L6RK20_PANMI|nr:retrotransposon protein, putative, unclassified [Panicum miliaceum]